MADLALKVADRIRIVESIVQMTLPAAEDIDAGQEVRLDTTTGRFTLANATAAAEAKAYGTAVKTVRAGMPVTAIRIGVLGGYDLDALDYGADVFLSNTDGTLADAAGTVSVRAGLVIPGTASTLGSSYHKLLYVEHSS